MRAFAAPDSWVAAARQPASLTFREIALFNPA
jgi:hypothetical protein